MAIPVPCAFSGASRLSLRASAPVLLVAIALCGCSFDLGSWSSAPDKEAAACLEAAVQADPQNAEIWTNRGLAYERLGDKAKAAGSYSRAINLRPRDETARNGFARVGGKPGQNYDAF